MPAAVAAAAVTSAGALGGAYMQNRSANRSTDAQLAANREAMNYEREQQWRAGTEARRQWEGYMRATYGDRYQPQGAATATPAAGAAPAGAPAAGPVTAPTPTVSADVPPPSLGTAAPTPPTDLPPVERDRTMASVGPWSASNFGQYLGRR